MTDSALSRARNPDLPTSELRIDDVPKELLDMLDAVSLARGDKSRRSLVIEVLSEYARIKAREWTLIERVMGGNQTIRDLARMDAE